MTELRSAIAAILEEDVELKKLATGGVWFEVAGEKGNVEPPFIVIGVPSELMDFAFQGNSWDWDVWYVKGVGAVDVAEAINERCKELLTDAELEMPGRELQYIRPFSGINYPEPADGERYQHVGANYRVTSERNE
jgi:hypothetical protein